MATDVKAIQKLREATGVGMMDAKKALEEANGDQDKAVEVLRKKGQAKAAKRAEREAKAGVIESYVHMDRVGVLVEVNCETDFVARTDDFRQLTRDLAMQVAATNPQYVTPDEVPEDVVNAEKEVYKADIEGKPENVQEQILSGRLEKFYAEVCLLKQPFIKDGDKTVEAVVTEAIAKLGENIVVSRFARFELGAQ